MSNDYFCMNCALEHGELIKLDADDDVIPIKCPVCKAEESYYPRDEFFERAIKFFYNLTKALGPEAKEKYYWEE